MLTTQYNHDKETWYNLHALSVHFITMPPPTVINQLTVHSMSDKHIACCKHFTTLQIYPLWHIFHIMCVHCAEADVGPQLRLHCSLPFARLHKKLTPFPLFWNSAVLDIDVKLILARHQSPALISTVSKPTLWLTSRSLK